MIKKTTTNIVFISSAMALVVSALAYGYLLLVFSNMRTNIKDLYDTHAESKAVLAELNKVEQNLKATLASRDRLLSLLVRQESIVDFIQTLEALMKKAGITGSVDTVSEEPISGDGASNKEKLLVALSASGSWQGIVKFVGLLEKIPYKSAINSLSISYTETDTKGKDGKVIASKGEWQVEAKMYALVIKTSPARPQSKTQ